MLSEKRRIKWNNNNTTADYNKAQQEIDIQKADNAQLREALACIKADVVNTKKRWLWRENTIKAKEAALTTREVDENERDNQLTLLKAHVTKLVLRSSDLEDQNKLLKLKLLTSEEMHRNTTPANNAAPHMSQSMLQRQLENLTSLLHTSMLAVTSNKLYTASQPTAKITNI